MEAAEAVLKFLRSVGPRTEAEFYLELFRRAARESFATLVVDRQTMAESADAVAVDLRFLAQLELTPVVVLDVDDSMRPIQHAKLEQLLRAQGVQTTQPLAAHEVETIAAAARAGVIPLVYNTSDDRDDADVSRLSALLAALHSHKLIFVRQAGGLRVDGERLSLVDLGTETDALIASQTLTAGELRLLHMARALTKPQPTHKLTMSITSPLNLLHELFTIRGAGTLLRWAATITRHDGLVGVDVTKLESILETSFERRPHASVFRRRYAHCYLDSSYRGAALLVQCPFGGYLNKFAVTREAQGEGLGRDLWRAVCNDYEKLLWRARADNAISSWYEQQCQGRYRTGDWTVYTRGIAPEALPEAIAYAQSQPSDFATDDPIL